VFLEDEKMKRFLLVCMALFIVGFLVGCKGGKSQSGSPSAALTGPGDWNYKYPEMVTVAIGRSGDQTNYFDGENYENNIFTNWIKDTYNIEIKSAFWVNNDADHFQKVALAISSGDIPDIMQVYNRQQLMELMESGMVEDLTGIFDKWASPLYKAEIETFNGLENAMSSCFIDGRQYAMAATNPSGQDCLFWVRDDWRLKLGLPEPKTLDDFVALADAFVKNDMAGGRLTTGLEIQSPMAGDYNYPLMADPFLMEVGAYPRNWIEDSNGKIVYGSVMPQVKEGLRTIRDLYAKGIIPKDYVTKDHRAALAAGHIGVVVGPWWINSAWLNTTYNNNPNVIWGIYNWRSNKTGKRYTYEPNINNRWVVVKKGYNHPELLTRFMNLTAEVRVYYDGNLLTEEEEKRYQVVIPEDVRNAYRGRQFNNWTSWPLSLQVDFKDYMSRLAVSDQRNLDNFKAGNTTGFTAPMLTNVENIVKWENGDRSIWEPQFYFQRHKGKQFSLSDANTIDVKDTFWPYSSETMQTRWANLLDLEYLAFNDIVMGRQPLDYFDTFVRLWNEQGGATITEDVNKQFGR
jgi:putative aldouronate transport system substrate-binding protein